MADDADAKATSAGSDSTNSTSTVTEPDYSHYESEAQREYARARTAAKQAAAAYRAAGGKSTWAAEQYARYGVTATPGTAEYWAQMAGQLQNLTAAQKALSANSSDYSAGLAVLKEVQEETGMSMQSLVETIERFKANPSAPEFQGLDLAKLAGFVSLAGAEAKSFAQQWAKSQVVTTPEGQLDLEESVRSGVVDPSVYKLAGFKVSRSQVDRMRKYAEARDELSAFVRDDALQIVEAVKAKKPLALMKQAGFNVTERDIAQVNAFLVQLKTAPVEVRQAYETGGLAAYRKAAKAYEQQVTQEYRTQEDEYLESTRFTQLPAEVRALYANDPDRFWEQEHVYWQEQQATFEAQQATIADLDQKGYVERYQVGYIVPETAGPREERINVVSALQGGYDELALVSVVGPRAVDEAKAYILALNELEPYRREDGYDTLAAVKSGVSEATLRRVFEGDVVATTLEAEQSAESTGVALPGEVYWENRLTGEIASASELRERNLTGEQEDEWVRTVPEVKRMAVTGLASFVFAPSRALLPEVKLSDVKGIDYAIGAAQLATWAMPWTPKGILPFTSLGASGVFGYTTAANWGSMSTPEKVLSVGVTALVAAPAVAAVAKGIKPVTIRTPGGDVRIFPVVTIKGTPRFGLHSGIERTLGRMGVPEAEITKLINTLKETSKFAGRKSPYGAEAEIVATKTLSEEGVQTVLKFSQEAGPSVERIYGSTTIRSQVAPELKNWRTPGDIDIQTTLGTTDTEIFAQELATRLQKTDPSIRVSPEKPTLIEMKGPDGQWHHAVDIHSKEAPSALGLAESESTTFAMDAYGFEFTKPAVTLEYSGIGKIRIMRLDESGIRKMSGITEWHEGLLQPAAHRGKDIVDYYIILRTFEGAGVADDWARTFGMSPDELMQLAAEAPPELTAWEFIPSQSASPHGLPTMTIHVPALVGVLRPSPTIRPVSEVVAEAYARLPSMPRIAASPPSVGLAKPMSTSIPIARSGGAPSYLSPPEISSPSIASILVTTSPALTSSPLLLRPPVSPGVSPATPESPGSYDSGSPPTGTPPSPGGPPSQPIAPPSTSPGGGAYQPVPDVPWHRPVRTPKKPSSDTKKSPIVQLPAGSIAWRQGAPWGKEQIKYVPPPWTAPKPFSLLGVRPVGWIDKGRTPAETIQIIGRAEGVPARIDIDLGVADITVLNGEEIIFKGKGLQTDVGTRIASTTRGMSIVSGTRRAKISDPEVGRQIVGIK